MRADLTSRGEKVPADWEWIGDVESLVIDITHKAYYVEVLLRPRCGLLQIAVRSDQK